MSDIVIVAAMRTPIGKYGGALRDIHPRDLAIPTMQHVMEEGGVSPEEMGDDGVVIYGCGRQASYGPNIARQIAVLGGLPASVPAWTVNQACASGLRAVINGVHEIESGQARYALVGGTESMSGLPYYVMQARWGMRLGSQPLVDAMYQDGFNCPMAGMPMGATADLLAAEYGISREATDAYALLSYERALAAQSGGHLAEEILPFNITDSKGRTSTLAEDEAIRPSSLEALGRLAPVFNPEGVVTAGNASAITDGAASLLLMSAEDAAARNLTPLARIEDWAQAGVDPKRMGIGPVPAVKKLLARHDLAISDIDLWEINEAFACQVLACNQDLGIPSDRLNVNGGGISIGHPIGCTGARILLHLAYEMRRRQVRRGVATLCVSGGMGVAVLLEGAGDQ
ncbi:MAG: Acetyl-CoA acetyltransferase [bacterium]|nr:Acetyl-CoA acetyltransferase [bacterium]